jgi:hypothetical protein
MRLAVDTHRVTFRFIGTLLLMFSFALLAVAIARRELPLVMIGFVGLIFSLFLRRSASCLLMRPAEAVLQQIEATLSLMSIRHTREANRVTISSTGTRAEVRGFGPVALMTFAFGERGSAREWYIRRTLIKFQR